MTQKLSENYESAIGVYNGQGPNIQDTSGGIHMIGRFTYPFKFIAVEGETNRQPLKQNQANRK